MYLLSQMKTDSFHGGDLIIGREAGCEVIMTRRVLVFCYMHQFVRRHLVEAAAYARETAPHITASGLGSCRLS